MSERQDSQVYEALNFDGLERRGNYRIIAYREDILHILDKKEEAAIIYQIISRWQTEVHRERLLKEIAQRKKAGQPPTPEEIEDRMWVYMSYNDFVRESGQALGYNTVIRNLNYLVNTKKVIERRENRDPHYSDYEYRINKEVVIDLLQALPPFPSIVAKIPKKKKTTSTQMGTANNQVNPEQGSTQMGTGSTQMGTGSTQMGTEVYPNGGTSHNYTSSTSNNTEKHDVIDAAHADVSTTSQFSLSDLTLEELQTELAKRQLPTPSSSNEQAESKGTQETVTPTPEGKAPRRSAGSKRGKRTKKDEAKDLLALSEIPSPEKPDPDKHPYNVELFIKLGDYYRGAPLPESGDPRSRYMKAILAAKNLVQRKITFEQVDKLFCYLLGRGAEIGLPELKDEKWIAGKYNTDLWTLESNFTSKWLECVEMEKVLRGKPQHGEEHSAPAQPAKHKLSALELRNREMAARFARRASGE